MKKVIVVMLLLNSLFGKFDVQPTMTLLIPKSSVILTDSEGEKPSISTLSYTPYHYEPYPITIINMERPI